MNPKLPSYSMENGYVLTRQLLDEGKEFTAVFAFSDTMAVGACRAIAEAGKRIPGLFCCGL